MWSQQRNYWKDNGDMPDTDEGEAEHSHCKKCFKIKCRHNSTNSCSLMHCPLLCGAVFHSCKANEHKELCSREIVPCINSFYGCKQSLRRSERGCHLATCPASVVYCTMEWNRWPVFSRERQERVPFTQKNLHARYGQLDVALAMRDQRILYEAMKAPRRMRRSLRNRLTERFPAVPLTNSHSSYVESSYSAGGVTSDEDAGGDAPWELSRDPPGLQRSICKGLFKTDSGSLHLDALDAQEQERSDSENVDENTVERGLPRNNSQTAACSSCVQKDTVQMSEMQFQGCDMVGFPASEGSGSSSVDILAGNINHANAGDFALVDKHALLHELSDKTSEDSAAGEEALEQNRTENSLCETKFHNKNQEPVDGSSLAAKTVDTTDQSDIERVSDVEKEVTLVSASGNKISCDSGSVPSYFHTSTSDKTCNIYEKFEPISVAGDILEGRASSAGITCESGFNKISETESRCSKDTFIESTCERHEPAVQAAPATSRLADQTDVSYSSVENVFSKKGLSRLPAGLTTSDADFTASSSFCLLQNSSAGAFDSDAKATPGANSVEPDSLHHCTDIVSVEESSALSVQNSCHLVPVSGEASVTSDNLTDAAESAATSEPLRRLSECQRVTADAAESRELFHELVFVGIDFANVSSLCHRNSVVFLPPTSGTIANPGTVVVDLPNEYRNVVESNSVPPPTFPPPLTLQEILALDLNLESITRYQAKPRSMYTFLCAQNFRRDEYPWHFKNVHSEIHGGLNGWLEARCPLACYGCTYSIRRINPVNGTVMYDSGVDAFGVRPNSWHCKALGELFEGASQVPERAKQEATPEIYTSKDYDSVVNFTHRSHAKEEELPEEEWSSLIGFTDTMAVEAQGKDTCVDRHKPPDDHDVFPSCSDLSKETMQSAFQECYSSPKGTRDNSLESDSITNTAEGAIVKGRDKPLLLSMLPFEVLLHIAHCLDSFSLCNLAMTSHFLREVCRSIVEHRGIVVQEWEKKQFDTGSSWQVTYQRWLFSSNFTPVEKWHFETSPSVSEHLKVCPFNVMAEPRRLPFQLCCLAKPDNDYRNQEAEKKLQKMYPDFDPKSTEFADGSSRLPGPEVLDHLYVNEIGKSGFSGYKRALKSFALSRSEQFRDSGEPELETKTVEEFGESLEPKLETKTLEEFGEFLEPKLETKPSDQFEDCLEPRLETKTSEQVGDYLEPKLDAKASEQFGDCVEQNLERKT